MFLVHLLVEFYNKASLHENPSYDLRQFLWSWVIVGVDKRNAEGLVEKYALIQLSRFLGDIFDIFEDR